MLRLALLAAVVAALFPGTATAADDGLIAFTVAESGFDVVGPDGTGRRPLLRESGAYSPAWSPDGTRIAFHAGGDIHVAHVTSDLQVLRVDRVTAGRSPTWSPDGARLAYV